MLAEEYVKMKEEFEKMSNFDLIVKFQKNGDYMETFGKTAEDHWLNHDELEEWANEREVIADILLERMPREELEKSVGFEKYLKKLDEKERERSSN